MMNLPTRKVKESIEIIAISGLVWCVLLVSLIFGQPYATKGKNEALLNCKPIRTINPSDTPGEGCKKRKEVSARSGWWPRAGRVPPDAKPGEGVTG